MIAISKNFHLLPSLLRQSSRRDAPRIRLECRRSQLALIIDSSLILHFNQKSPKKQRGLWKIRQYYSRWLSIAPPGIVISSPTLRIRTGSARNLTLARRFGISVPYARVGFLLTRCPSRNDQNHLAAEVFYDFNQKNFPIHLKYDRIRRLFLPVFFILTIFRSEKRYESLSSHCFAGYSGFFAKCLLRFRGRAGTLAFRTLRSRLRSGIEGSALFRRFARKLDDSER